MKKMILMSWFVALSAQAAIKVESSNNCELREWRITEFVVSQDNKKLSYRAGGKLYPLAEASSGVLVGGFRALMMSGSLEDFDGKWLDMREIPLSEIEARKAKTIDQIFYYLPLQRTLAPSDLGLDNNWKITTFAYDYNWHAKGSDGDKEWQFIVKNSRTGATNTVMAQEAERRMLERCR